MKGFFIDFEGADGSGKSTQLHFLAEYLEERGLGVVHTREPGGCPVAEKIRALLLDNENGGMTDVCEAFLYAAARAEHVRQVIKPALSEGKIVLCDRYLLSSLAYQGYGRQLGAEAVRKINLPAVDGCLPDVTIFINIKPENAFKRMNEHKIHDRLELEDISFHERVYAGFSELAKGKDVISVDARGTKFETHEMIKQKVLPLLKKAGVL